MGNFEKPDIVQVISTHVELKQRGRDLWGLCPFHPEKTPSFRIRPDYQTFTCFGCGRAGDVIAFIMAYKGLDFRAAMDDLGISEKPISKSSRSRERKKKEILQEFRSWCLERKRELFAEYRAIHRFFAEFSTMEEVETHFVLLHELSAIEFELDLLINGDDREKYELYRGQI